MLRASSLVLLAITLGGCPRDVEIPDRSEEARSCESEMDCNDGATCGQLRLCVDSLCEAQPSGIVACRDGG